MITLQDCPSSVSQVTAQPEYYIDVVEAAEFLNMSVRTVTCWAQYGLIPAHVLRSGSQSCWKFKISELAQWLKEDSRWNVPKPFEVH